MDDERLAKIEQEKQNAINNSTNTYNQLINENQDLYNKQLEYANKYEQTQNDILNQQLAENQRLIEQQKEEARKNKAVEERKALNDYEAYNNPYGYQSEARASSGLLNSGISETAKLGSFNTYQNRLATANKVMQDAITQYDNDINQARLNNDVSKAQNALNKLKLQLDYAETYYGNNKDLTINQLSTNQNLDSNYFNRFQTIYDNIQKEKEREEAIRQYNEKMAYQRERDAVADAQWAKEYALSKQKVNNSYGGYEKFDEKEPVLSSNLKNNTATILEYSKRFSSAPAIAWWQKNILGEEFTEKQLENTLRNALSKKYITSSDADEILKSYGL